MLPKISPPSNFSGKPRDLEDFITDMELFFGCHETHYRDQPERRIKLILMYMNGEASEWRRAKIAEYNGTVGTAINKWNNYGQFLNELRARFGEVLGSGRAQNALENMKWRKGISYSQWVGKKDALITKAGIIGNEQKIHALLKGLQNDDITRALDHYQSGNREYAEIMTYIQSLDTTRGLARLLAGSNQFRPQRRDEWAMDVDRVNIQGSTSNSAPSTSRIDKSGTTCFNCGKQGHWSNECRSPKKEGFKGKSAFQSLRNRRGRKGRLNKKGKGRRIRSTEMDDEEDSDNDMDTAEEDEATQELSVIRSLVKELPKNIQKRVRNEINQKGF